MTTAWRSIRQGAESAVLGQLRRAWHERSTPSQGTWDAATSELASLREELNGLVNALHRRRENGLSPMRPSGALSRPGGGSARPHMAGSPRPRRDDARQPACSLPRASSRLGIGRIGGGSSASRRRGHPVVSGLARRHGRGDPGRGADAWGAPGQRSGVRRGDRPALPARDLRRHARAGGARQLPRTLRGALRGPPSSPMVPATCAGPSTRASAFRRRRLS